jgi:DNA-binding transcriptional LysR family regulator
MPVELRWIGLRLFDSSFASPGIRVEMPASDSVVNFDRGRDRCCRASWRPRRLVLDHAPSCNSFVTVAMSRYLAWTARPSEPSDLNKHSCIAFSRRRAVRPWLMTEPRCSVSRKAISDEQLRVAVLEHPGIAHVSAWLVTPDLASGLCERSCTTMKQRNSRSAPSFPADTG